MWALKQMLLLERNPRAGNLVGHRKLVVGDRDWRIVWRTTTDDRGSVVIEIADMWAVGARAASEAYAKMTNRVAAMVAQPANQRWRVSPRRSARPRKTSQRGHRKPPPTPEP